MIGKGQGLRLGAFTAVLLGMLIGSSTFAATIIVNSLADPGAPGIWALRDAISASNATTITNGCAAGTGNDIVQFSVSGTITLGATMPAIARNLSIVGPGSSCGITISGNSSHQIMVVNSGAQLTLRFLTLINGHAISKGGAISNSGTLTIGNSTFTSNFGGAQGGAIFNVKTAIISTSTFEGNETSVCRAGTGFCGGGEGAAIFNSGTLLVARTTFSGNSTKGLAGAGGAIYNNTGTASVINSTFSANHAVGGGAIYNSGPTPASITNTTFSRNSAGNGAAVFGPSKIKGSILAAISGGGENCSSPPSDIGYNISNDDSCKFTQTGSDNNLDPRLSLAGLSNNGGPTHTIALQVTSPAIDAIPLADCTDQSSPPNQITIDQRGFPRPDAREQVCDIGAYESQ